MLGRTLKIVDPGISDSSRGGIRISSENLMFVMDTVFQIWVTLIPSLVLIRPPRHFYDNFSLFPEAALKKRLIACFLQI